MDDGYKSNNGFYFCTESYTLEDNYKLKNILKLKFDLDCGVHKHTNCNILYVYNKSSIELMEKIKPYIVPHFNYKLKSLD